MIIKFENIEEFLELVGKLSIDKGEPKITTSEFKLKNGFFKRCKECPHNQFEDGAFSNECIHCGEDKSYELYGDDKSLESCMERS